MNLIFGKLSHPYHWICLLFNHEPLFGLNMVNLGILPKPIHDLYPTSSQCFLFQVHWAKSLTTLPQRNDFQSVTPP
jgi:hypothetical protein